MSNQPPLNPDALAHARSAAFDCWENGGNMDDLAECAIEAYLAAAQPEVNSVEELDALPAETVVIDAHGFPYRRGRSFGTGHVGDWEGIEYGELLETDTIEYPARVLYRPTEESTNGR